MRSKKLMTSMAALAAVPLVAASGAAQAAPRYSTWSVAAPVAEVNDPAVPDGCPIESRDGLSLYIASSRTGTLGANDVWAADRASKSEPFGQPQNLGAPVNSAAADFCPTPIYGNYLMFVSERPGPETCGAGPGLGDIYIIRPTPPSDGASRNTSAASRTAPARTALARSSARRWSSCRTVSTCTSRAP
jgi:WD40-like Beta Propeller Repeat